LFGVLRWQNRVRAAGLDDMEKRLFPMNYQSRCIHYGFPAPGGCEA
jgi:hypothetical protein